MNVTNDGKDLMGVGMLVPAPGVAQEDYAKKIRKPYTITKSRESWTEQEHEKFLQALHLYDRDWKKIEQYVGTKTVIQIRSHAQKYFLKVQKNGTGEHVPPPRPKRKSAQPYPQKAPKPVLVPSASTKVNAASGGAGQSRPDGNVGGPWVKQVRMKLLSSVYDRDGLGLDGAGDPGMSPPSVMPTMPTVSCP
ncbi:hypothetical protein CBR_g855 [Chara braunii]|uniref:Uncharacterized protein n=1 Tax=Chara braunii TaxID=69332 RepID=A0A388KCI6_CHABU|nr:hypothetical protein CBR_g855 [Chara braunii]|eukprot:GBG67727.1 hypothetical protein CBR_g855 [Chara braunii]